MLALSQAWWSWNAPAIHKALTAAHHGHWWPQLELALKATAKSDEQASEREKLTALRRNPRNIRRVVEGQSAATPGFLLGIAGIFGLEVQHLYPNTAAWITGATASLCGGCLSENDCAVYVAFVLQRPAAGMGPSQSELEQKLRAIPAKNRTTVLRVARALGRALQMADRKLQERETSQ